MVSDPWFWDTWFLESLITDLRLDFMITVYGFWSGLVENIEYFAFVFCLMDR